eukprot:4656865-Amphidinium_carterae.3
MASLAAMETWRTLSCRVLGWVEGYQCLQLSEPHPNRVQELESEVRRRVMTVTSGHLDLIVVVNSCRVPATGIARVLSLLSQMPRIVFQRGAGTRDATSYIKRACLISACPPDEEAIEGLLTKAFVNLLSRTQGPIKWQQLLAQDLQNEVRRAGGMQAAPTPEILVWGAMPEDESDESGHLLQLPGGWA